MPRPCFWKANLFESFNYSDYPNNEEILIMDPIEHYKKTLEKLKKHRLIDFQLSGANGGIAIGGVPFKRVNRLSLMKSGLSSGQGILVRDLSPEEEKFCRANEVSFLTIKGKLFLVTESFRLEIEIVQHHKASKTKKINISKRTGPSATALISPNGLEILDVLFRLAPENLAEFKSALSFTHEFHLSQPKLSLMMTEMNVKTIGDLKEKIKSLPNSWWESSFRYSMTKKGLPPFFEGEKIFRSIKAELTRDQIQQDINIWLGNRFELLHGPVEVVKKMGLIRDDDIYLWGTLTAIQEVKASFKLIPDRKIKEVNWHITIPSMGLEKAAVLSPLAGKQYVFFLPEIKTNLFRSIWDLGFGGERLQEIQITALRRILDEIR